MTLPPSSRSKSLLNVGIITRHYTVSQPEHNDLDLYRRENMKSRRRSKMSKNRDANENIWA